MARSTKSETASEAAYAEAAAKLPTKKPVARKVAAKPKAPVKAKPAKLASTPDAAPEPVVAAAPEPVVAAAPEPVTPPAPEPVVEAAPEPEVAAAPLPVAPEPAPAIAITQPAPVATATADAPAKTPRLTLKDITMTTDFASFTAPMNEAVAEMQTRIQAAYEKSTSVVTEMTELAKGNVEAVVESSKLFAAGVQDMGKTYADEAKSAYETVTADIKEMAAIKSPTELFQLQGKIMRRNFDAMIAATSKSTDAALKLANDAMAPITGRVNVAAEKLAQVAA